MGTPLLLARSGQFMQACTPVLAEDVAALG